MKQVLCEICKHDVLYAKGLCYRCYMRLYMRNYKKKRNAAEDRGKTAVLRHVIERYENLGLECPHCRNTREFFVDFDHAEIICRICGLVLTSGYNFNTFFPNNPSPVGKRR